MTITQARAQLKNGSGTVGHTPSAKAFIRNSSTSNRIHHNRLTAPPADSSLAQFQLDKNGNDDNEALDVDGQIVRKVLSHDLDGGVSLLKSLGQDLRQLAINKACDHVLLATDDERFLTVIDDAQLTGLSVHILADDAARNMAKLHQTVWVAAL